MTIRIWACCLALASGLYFPSAAAATAYKVDPEHTSVGFRVRHLFTQVKGRFNKFEGQIVFDPTHPEQTKVQGWIDAASVDTSVEERDKDLRSPRFFDVEKYPKITFASTSVSGVDATKKSGKLNGNLTIHGVEKPVTLEARILGATCAPAFPRTRRSIARISDLPGTRLSRPAACWSATRSRSRSKLREHWNSRHPGVRLHGLAPSEIVTTHRCLPSSGARVCSATKRRREPWQRETRRYYWHRLSSAC